jgi:Uma2 family endonuclease
MEVVVEILSADDAMGYVIEKCRAYQTWGFAAIYVLDPASRSLFQWTGRALEVSQFLTSVPAAKIWEQLDKAKLRKRE